MDHFTGEKQLLPLSLVPKPKSSFIPSKWEHRKIVKLVHAIRMGWVKPHPKVPSKPPLYQLWGEGSDDSKRKHRMHIPAPRMPLPGHGESYNPPPEYLPTQNEVSKMIRFHPLKPFFREKSGWLRMKKIVLPTTYRTSKIE